MSKNYPTSNILIDMLYHDNHDSLGSVDEAELNAAYPMELDSTELDDIPIKVISSLVNITDIINPIEYLIKFASIGNLEGVRSCIETSKTDPNKSGLSERLAINEAINNGHYKIVQYLINHGADIHHKGKYQKKKYLLNAVEAAQECGIKEIQDIILSKLKSETIFSNSKAQHSINSLIAYVIQGNLTEVIRCVEILGINPNEYSASKSLALHEAIYRKNFGITKYLIEHGADIHKEGYHHGRNRHYDAFDASHNFGTHEIHQLVVRKLIAEAAAEAEEKDKPTSQVDELSYKLFDFKPFTRARNER